MGEKKWRDSPPFCTSEALSQWPLKMENISFLNKCVCREMKVQQVTWLLQESSFFRINFSQPWPCKTEEIAHFSNFRALCSYISSFLSDLEGNSSFFFKNSLFYNLDRSLLGLSKCEMVINLYVSWVWLKKIHYHHGKALHIFVILEHFFRAVYVMYIHMS